MSFGEKLYRYSLIFLKGTRIAFEEGFDLLCKESESEALLYFRNLKSDICPGGAELFSVSLNGESPSRPSYFPEIFSFEEDSMGLNSMLSSGKIIIEKTENLPKAENLNICKYIKSDRLAFVPCFLEGEWKGVIAASFYGDKRPDLDLLNQAAELVSRSAEYVNSFFQVSRGESKYRAILENIEDGYFEIDLAGNLRAFNDAVCRISGLSRKELMGLNNREYTSDKTAKNMFRVFSEIYRTNIPLKVKDYEVLLRNGEKKWLELSSSLIKNDSNEAVGFRGLVRDVTARKKGEYERKRLEEKLNQAQRLEAIGTLAGGIAHDFNNLLMAIQGNASLIMTASKGNKIIQDKAVSIEKCVENGANLTRQLLGFARGGKYIARPCNINRVIDASLVMFARAHKELTIDTEFSDNLDLVEADQSQLEQVLMNLYLNAWHAMDGMGIIRIKTKNIHLDSGVTSPYDLPPGDYVVVEVADNGQGMDEETKKRIFEPFFTTKEKGRGTGLGLASVFGIVKNHDGFINVSSKPGKGTSFKLFFPSFKEELDSFYDKGKKPVTDKKIKSVLLVDDEESILEVGAAMLSEIGYSVTTAGGGHEAVSVFREKKDNFDLVILDMVMPDLDGMGTYGELKKIDPRVSVLFSSGYIEEEQYKKDNFEEKLSKAFISKPYNLSALSLKINELIGSDN